MSSNSFIRSNAIKTKAGAVARSLYRAIYFRLTHPVLEGELLELLVVLPVLFGAPRLLQEGGQLDRLRDEGAAHRPEVGGRLAPNRLMMQTLRITLLKEMDRKPLRDKMPRR